jgi:hypothetical protein
MLDHQQQVVLNNIPVVLSHIQAIGERKNYEVLSSCHLNFYDCNQFVYGNQRQRFQPIHPFTEI